MKIGMIGFGARGTLVLRDIILPMAELGVFGKVVHCKGGYRHDLREEVSTGAENRHYRLRNYLKHNCENYPTHELGSIAQLIHINRGNRMVSLVSMASKSEGLHEFREFFDSVINGIECPIDMCTIPLHGCVLLHCRKNPYCWEESRL